MQQVYIVKNLVPPPIADLVHIEANTWLITRINVPTIYRGAGHATAMLRQILHDADHEQATLVVQPSSSGGLNLHQLISWYERYGFVDHDDERGWVREPKRKMPEFVVVDLDSGESHVVKHEKPDDSLDQRCADGMVECIRFTGEGWTRWNGAVWTKIPAV